MRNIIHPLHLEASLRGANSRVGWVPWVDCLLICLGLILLSSHFLFPPGVGMTLPSFSGPLAGKPVAAVLSARSGNMIIFEDSVFTERGLQSYLEGQNADRKAQGLAPVDRGVLLVQLDQSVSVQVFLNICELAYNAGFSEIQIAATERDIVLPEGS